MPPGCEILWRQRKLIVQPLPLGSGMPRSSSPDQTLLIECLKRSRVKLVKLDLACGEEALTFWVETCLQAGKPAFLRIPASFNLFSNRYPGYRHLRRSVDWLGAALLLILCSPVLLLLGGLIRLISPGSIVLRQWRVGRRGNLFQLIRFRTTVLPAKSEEGQGTDPLPIELSPVPDPYIQLIGYGMHRFKLDRLPQLWNVLRGEMSLVGPRAYTLEDALTMETDDRHRLNALPGIIGIRRKRSYLLGSNTSDLARSKYVSEQSLDESFEGASESRMVKQ